MTKTKLREFAIFFGIQFLNYGLLCVSYRAIDKANYAILGTVDFTIASLNFFVIRKIAKSEESVAQWAGYAAGGVVGSLLGTWASINLLAN